jgi:hypothetical protein
VGAGALARVFRLVDVEDEEGAAAAW